MFDIVQKCYGLVNMLTECFSIVCSWCLSRNDLNCIIYLVSLFVIYYLIFKDLLICTDPSALRISFDQFRRLSFLYLVSALDIKFFVNQLCPVNYQTCIMLNVICRNLLTTTYSKVTGIFQTLHSGGVMAFLLKLLGGISTKYYNIGSICRRRANSLSLFAIDGWIYSLHTIAITIFPLK